MPIEAGCAYLNRIEVVWLLENHLLVESQHEITCSFTSVDNILGRSHAYPFTLLRKSFPGREGDEICQNHHHRWVHLIEGLHSVIVSLVPTGPGNPVALRFWWVLTLQ